MVDLTDSYEKLRRARHHLNVLRPQIEAFQNRDNHRITCNIDADAGEYTFYVSNLEALDPDWGLMIGDCIHNARTALDYLMVRLWALVTGTEPAEVSVIGFPIYSPDPDNPDGDAALAAAIQDFRSKTGKLAKEPRFSGYLTRIEELQPFNNGNVSIWGTTEEPWHHPILSPIPQALDRLATLDNADKHRVPHVTWATIDVFQRTFGLDEIRPQEFEMLSHGTTYAPLKEGAVIASARFQVPLPGVWQPDEMDVKRCFPLQVAFGQPSPFQGVIEVLALSLWAVEAVLVIFEPVFRPGNPQPPLPVTAIGEPGE